MFNLKRTRTSDDSREKRIADDAHSRLAAVLAQGDVVYAISARASVLRERNHFGQAIQESFLR